MAVCQWPLKKFPLMPGSELAYLHSCPYLHPSGQTPDLTVIQGDTTFSPVKGGVYLGITSTDAVYTDKAAQ